MIPIYEHGGGRGIGHNLDSFLERFEQICHEHRERKRAKAFAFIFYDFTDGPIRRILQDPGAFAQLDRLSGEALSIFFLHTGTKAAIKRFNSVFMNQIGIEEGAKPPCIVFFKLEGENLTEVTVANLDSADLIHGLKEMHDAIDYYIHNQVNSRPRKIPGIGWITGAAKFVSTEAVRQAIREMVGNLF